MCILTRDCPSIKARVSAFRKEGRGKKKIECGQNIVDIVFHKSFCECKVRPTSALTEFREKEVADGRREIDSVCWTSKLRRVEQLSEMYVVVIDLDRLSTASKRMARLSKFFRPNNFLVADAQSPLINFSKISQTLYRIYNKVRNRSEFIGKEIFYFILNHFFIVIETNKNDSFIKNIYI